MTGNVCNGNGRIEISVMALHYWIFAVRSVRLWLLAKKIAGVRWTVRQASRDMTVHPCSTVQYSGGAHEP